MALISGNIYGQGIDYSLYTSINVLSTSRVYLNGIPDNEYKKIDNNRFLNDNRPRNLTAHISDSSTKSNYYNETLLIGYFINNSNDTLLIDRCDGAILKAETQIFTGNKWVTFQLNLPSDCGLSYFATKLPPKSYYILQIPDPSDGPIVTKFRVKFRYAKDVFYTNDIVVRLTQERIAKTKQKINPFIWH